MADKDKELEGIRNAEHITFVDRLRGKLHPVMDRSDAGRVTYPRRDFLQAQADQRKAARDAEARRKKSGE